MLFMHDVLEIYLIYFKTLRKKRNLFIKTPNRTAQ